MAFIPPTGSTVAFQSDPTKLVGTMSVVGNMNASVTAVLAGNSSVITVSQGSVAVAIQNMPSPSVIAYQAAGSIMAVSATVNTGNSSVQLLGGVAVIGSVATLQGTNPWLIGNSSVQTIQGTTPWVVGSIIATVQSSVAVAVTNITASVIATLNNPNSSVMLTASTNHSVLAVLSNSSVTTLQGTNPWLIGNSSVLAFQGTLPWVIQSIVGTYAEDSGHVSGDKGILAFGVRNDTVASLVNADLDYGAWAQDSAGRHIIKPFAANEASIFAHASVVNGGDSGSVVVFAAAGAGLRNYITDYQVANTGSVSTLITFTEGGGSIIGRTIAPAGGGSNAIGWNSPIRNNLANQPINMVTGTASSIVYVAAYGHKAP